MALKGKAFLAMWHDIKPEAVNDYTEWHTREHMPERLSIPGFTIGKRFVNRALPRHAIGTIYAGENLEVFRSPAYLERLNNPTDWSNRMQPNFLNFLRVACEKVASRGVGDGGAIATIRLDLKSSEGGSGFAASAGALCEEIYGYEGIVAVHAGLARNEVSSVRTRETEIRPPMAERGFDVVIVIEGNSRAILEALIKRAEKAALKDEYGLKDARTEVYDLAYQLTSEEMQ